MKTLLLLLVSIILVNTCLGAGGQGHQIGVTMAELENGKTVSLEELMVSTLAMTDALAKLLIEKGLITDAEFKQKLL